MRNHCMVHVQELRIAGAEPAEIRAKRHSLGMARNLHRE
jgi:hypothetical protein